MKKIIIKSNQLFDNLKEPYRFLSILFTIGFISFVFNVYNFNIYIELLYYLILILIFIWRILGYKLQK
jgi:hypothetical protein